MRISELIEHLQAAKEQHGDLDVIIEWECTYNHIDAIGYSPLDDGRLLLNADGGYYPPEKAKGGYCWNRPPEAG